HLTPNYDVLSAWPVIGHGNNQISWQKCKLAMAVRGSSNFYQIYRIQRRHWIWHGEITGLSKQQTEAMIEEIIARTPGVIERVSGLLPDQFPQQLAESIFDGMRQQCRRLAEK
ncbi:type II toxin-antitoxin system HipA family toxin, partial [Escherichia coli]